MALILPYRGIYPKIHSTCYVAPDAIVVGDVEIGRGSSLWFKTMARGDVHWIRIGEETNIQDGTMLHVTGPDFPLTVGSNVSVGHGAVLHGATVGDGCLIGIRAVLLDGSEIGAGSVVAAGTLVPEGMEIEPGSMVMGVPAKVVREVGPAERKRMQDTIAHYRELVEEYIGITGPVDPGDG
jgi:carbonic anhydrase/acetyltransferase-like protein (isoleucine patch superfamily)